MARAVASVEPPGYERAAVDATSFTPFEERVRSMLTEFPEMPATVLAERVGWSGSPSWFRENVARLRPEQRRPDPADRLAWDAGDAAQCDLWFPPKKIPLEDGTTALLPVLVMVPAYSRFITGRMLPTRQTPDLLLGSWSLIEQFGRVPRRLIWDNEAGIGRHGRLAGGVAEFCGTLATDADRAAMLALPPIPPRLGWVNQIRLGRDYSVRVDSNAAGCVMVAEHSPHHRMRASRFTIWRLR